MEVKALYTSYERNLDQVVRERLRQWPNNPPGLSNSSTNAWLRGRPDEDAQCFLKQPGSDKLRTLPDGLWLSFGGTPDEPFADVFAIEACSTLSNLLDKRSRFAPSTQSRLAVCPLAWLMAPLEPGSRKRRWQATGVLPTLPDTHLVLPVRDVRVMYGLRARLYEGFMANQVPQPHELFAPMETLTAENGDRDPALQALVARASVRANFYCGLAA